MTEDPEARTPAYNVPLSLEEHALVGGFVIVWNQCEQLVEIAVFTMLNVSLETTEFLMSSPNVPPKADAFLAIARDKLDDAVLLKDAKKCADKLKELSNFRNSVAHGRWAFNVDNDSAESRKKLISGEAVSISKIDQKYEDICSLSKRLADLNWRIIQHLHPKAPARGPSPWHGKF